MLPFRPEGNDLLSFSAFFHVSDTYTTTTIYPTTQLTGNAEGRVHRIPHVLNSHELKNRISELVI